MRYFIAYMLTGETRVRHAEKSDELAERFRLIPVSKRVDPHITLKAPFETDEVRPVEELLERFAAGERPVPYRMNGIGAFDSRIIYRAAEVPTETVVLIRRLQEMLRTLPWLTFSATEFPLTPHVTLAYAKNRVQGKEILARLAVEHIPPEEASIDHVALLSRPTERWEVMRTFPFAGKPL
jgi:2'-5' RNA ligase